MRKLKVSEIVEMISKLGTHEIFKYYKGKTSIQLTGIEKPEGPIRFIRWGESSNKKSTGSISKNQLSMAAHVFSRKPNYPIHFDRLFSGSGNSRAAFETILALTPNFFICYPEKTNIYTGEIENNLKHIMWCPDEYHNLGVLETKNYTQIISELELDTDFGNIQINDTMLNDEFHDINTKRIHTQMQVAIVRIGNALNFKTWIAKNDHHIQIENSTLGSLEGVLDSLENIPILYGSESKKAASLIDCIWFSRDFRYIPAVIEIEHSTGVTSGLTRMLKLQETIPSVTMGYSVVAPNELRDKVVNEANNKIFKTLNVKYMPYSTIRELYGLIKKYKLNSYVDKNFITPFMENIVNDND